jgi:hypothetical protein
MSAFIERVTGGQNTGLTLVTKKNAPSYLKVREKQLGTLLGVED